MRVGKSLATSLLLCGAALGFAAPSRAIPVNCVVCGSTPIAGLGGQLGIVSYAVVTGGDFLLQPFSFVGLVPGGTLDLLGQAVNPTDYVYMYQVTNPSPNVSIASYQISLGGAAALLTAGGRLESTLFVDPNLGAPATVRLSPLPSTPPSVPGLSPGPMVDFTVFLNPGPCLGSGALPGNQCSDGTTNLLPNAAEMINFDETPSGAFVDPSWSSSIMFFASPLAPVVDSAEVFFTDATNFAGPVATVPEPTTALLCGAGLTWLAVHGRRRRS